MGLFKKKKLAIEKAKIEKTHEIICLYCFRNFNHDRVLFRAVSAIDSEGYRAAIDHPLDEYRARFFMGSLGELPVVLDPDEVGEANKGYLRGILSSLKDSHGNTSTKRLCPYCHNDVPAIAGFAPSTIISIIGAPGAGKSVYLTSLIHTLKSVTSHNFDVFCTPISNEMGRKFKFEYEDPLLDTGYLADSTQKQQEPLIFTFSFADGTKPEINIAFFDIVGEGRANLEYLEIFAAHVRNSSGVMFMVDPQQFRPISRRIHMMNQMNYDIGASREPAEVLSTLVENYIYKQSNGISNIPTAVVLTKTDLLEAISYEGDYIRPRSNVFSRYTHQDHLNLTQTDIVNYEIDEFIQRIDPNFRNALQRRFAHLGMFGVSSVGTNPDAINQRLAQFAPVRVDEPFLWLLYKLGYVEGFYEGARL
ncbi:MAG: hypothetical protein FWE11_05170 [Defluviitaleaceae bacterium]|nr:hypothetical protein [Defluviitaleaceae bacterium]